MELLGHSLLVLAALRLSWVDHRQFLIEYETLAIMGLVVVAMLWMDGGAAAVLRAATVSAAVVGAMACLVRLRLLRRPGAGDWALMFVCLLAGSRNLPVFSIVLLTTGMASAVGFAVSRGRPLLRSRFPLAPPLVLAAVAGHAFAGMSLDATLDGLGWPTGMQVGAR